MGTTQPEKRLRRMRNAPRATDSAELIWVLKKIGFTVRQGSEGHMVYNHPALAKAYPSFPRPRNPLHKCYIGDALDAIDELRSVLGGDYDGGGGI